MVFGKLIFISGGVRSGKSAYAEKLLTSARKKEGRLVYIASGTATDSEMKERIQKHQQDRAEFNWVTIEQPTNLAECMPSIQKGDYVLWDCMTTWLANELYDGWETGSPCIHDPNCMTKKEQQLLKTLHDIKEKASQFVIVSNEVLHDLPSNYSETETYRKWLGRLHQKVVKTANVAIEMEGGIPIYWKGERAL